MTVAQYRTQPMCLLTRHGARAETTRLRSVRCHHLAKPTDGERTHEARSSSAVTPTDKQRCTSTPPTSQPHQRTGDGC